MATLQKAIRVGSSIAAVLPKVLLKEAGITAGTRISVESIDGGVFIRSVRKEGGHHVTSADARVAETALRLINRYQSALERLSDEWGDDGRWETIVDFRSIDSQGIPARKVLTALHRLNESHRKIPRRA